MAELIGPRKVDERREDTRSVRLFWINITVALIAAIPGWIALYRSVQKEPDSEAQEVAITSEVVDVVKGDTFVINHEGELSEVRIWGVKAPGPGESGYSEAIKVLSDLILEETVTLRFKSSNKLDQSCRRYCSVIANGEDVAKEMLQRGLVSPVD